MAYFQKQRGFTLIELVFTMVLIGIISVVVGRILFQGFGDVITAENISNADWQGFTAIERMANDIHTIRSAQDISTIGAAQLVFTDVSGASVQFQLSGSTLLRNSETLAIGIQSLALTYLDGNGNVTATAANVRYIKIAMNMTQGNLTLGLQTLVGTRGMDA